MSSEVGGAGAVGGMGTAGAEATLAGARRRLAEALGPRSALYLQHVRSWFKMRLTKEEFDAEARALLPPQRVHLHNQFFLALLNKVQGLAAASVLVSQEKVIAHRNARRHKRSSRSEKSSFEPADLLEYLSPNSPPGAGSDGVKYASQELFLPDHTLVMGRFILAAWELGLEGAEDEAVDLIVAALQVFLKNTINIVISQRKGHKTHNGVMYDMSCDMPNMWLRNSASLYDPQSECRTDIDESLATSVPRLPPSIDEVEHATAYEIACSVPNQDVNSDKLSLQEVYVTLQVHRNVISSHSIYAINMERILTMLNHPSY